MIKLIIHRLDLTTEVFETQNASLSNIPSGTVVLFDPNMYRDGERDKPVISIRPYYRKQVGDLLTIYCEEDER